MTQAFDAIRTDLDDRIDAIGWGVFFVVSGIVLLVPALPDGSWLTATGAIIVGAAALRAHLGMPVSAFWAALGVGVVALGIATLVGLSLPWLATLMFVCGLGLVADVLVRQRRQA